MFFVAVGVVLSVVTFDTNRLKITLLREAYGDIKGIIVELIVVVRLPLAVWVFDCSWYFQYLPCFDLTLCGVCK